MPRGDGIWQVGAGFVEKNRRTVHSGARRGVAGGPCTQAFAIAERGTLWLSVRRRRAARSRVLDVDPPWQRLAWSAIRRDRPKKPAPVGKGWPPCPDWPSGFVATSSC